ncbi:MAG: hypothetical protein IKR69_01500 [Bacteroidales bacterium]|nr:hypothetical protein [Bacteroidales bacterium]
MKRIAAYICILSVFAVSCSKMTEGGTGTLSRYRNVMLLYSAGYNNLSSPMLRNITELQEGYVPVDMSSNDVMLVFNRRTEGYLNFKEPVPPVLIEVKRNWQGDIQMDTVKIWPAETKASTAQTMSEVLSYIKDSYPADSYGVVFSSHATGFLPEGYYSNPEDGGDDVDDGDIWALSRRVRRVRNFEEEPLTKSIGADYTGTVGVDLESFEIELPALAGAIPMHLDYFLFDACLMGGIEVAYELKDKVDIIGFSPTEVLSQGFYYDSMGKYLLGGSVPDPEAVCRDYLDKYLNGSTKAASVTVVDCRRIDPLVSICKTLFEKYREQISNLPTAGIQVYFRQDKHWFYDLEDILIHAGIDDSEKALLANALNDFIIFKGHTDTFFTIQFTHYSGLSMFLPSHSGDQLKSYYRQKIGWNKATALVK